MTKLEAVENWNRLEQRKLKFIQGRMEAAKTEEEKLELNKRCGLVRRIISEHQSTISRYKRAAH